MEALQRDWRERVRGRNGRDPAAMSQNELLDMRYGAEKCGRDRGGNE